MQTTILQSFNLCIGNSAHLKGLPGYDKAQQLGRAAGRHMRSWGGTIRKKEEEEREGGKKAGGKKGGREEERKMEEGEREGGKRLGMIYLEYIKNTGGKFGSKATLNTLSCLGVYPNFVFLIL